MKIFFFTLAVLFTFIACNKMKDDAVRQNITLSAAPSTVSGTPELISHPASTEESTPQYLGVSIDQQFPFVENHSFQKDDFKGKTYKIEAEEFAVVFTDFTPKSIQDENERSLFKFKTLHKEGYWANLVGISHLMGRDSKEIYVVASGTGGFCCSNYWITDISDGKPRNIFRSEDYGYFRDAMEIFDADGDGIYELMQFDSAFRYFMDDCGSCSPEPRAVFKYDRKKREYLPAKNLQQDFIKSDFEETEKQLNETFEVLKIKQDPTDQLNFSRLALAHVVDLFYLGEEKKAWKAFDKYFSGWSSKEEMRSEIKKRLKESKFFQALKKS